MLLLRLPSYKFSAGVHCECSLDSRRVAGIRRDEVQSRVRGPRRLFKITARAEMGNTRVIDRDTTMETGSRSIQERRKAKSIVLKISESLCYGGGKTVEEEEEEEYAHAFGPHENGFSVSSLSCDRESFLRVAHHLERLASSKEMSSKG
jgi:hypothetical protein